MITKGDIAKPMTFQEQMKWENKMIERVRKLKEGKPDPFWQQDFKAQLEEILKTFSWYKKD